MRKTILYAVLGLSAFAGIGFYLSQSQFTNMVHQYVENGEFITLKARYTPEQIMETHRKELLIDNQHSYQEPDIKFHPYLLMEVKYFQPDKKSREGVILWSLMDGEMVLNTETWEVTHGFEDAINADATRNDFKLMQALAKNRAPTNIERLQRDLHLEKETMQQWIDSALRKHLIVQKGNELQLHFQDPKILVQPETKVNDWLVKKPYNHAQRVSSRYTNHQIHKISQAAFGEDFAVRSATEVYLPIYSIEVINPDGSILTSYWNALNGKRLAPRYALPGW